LRWKKMRINDYGESGCGAVTVQKATAFVIARHANLHTAPNQFENASTQCRSHLLIARSSRASKTRSCRLSEASQERGRERVSSTCAAAWAFQRKENFPAKDRIGGQISGSRRKLTVWQANARVHRIHRGGDLMVMDRTVAEVDG
jgi:hypothetical protein